MKRSKLPALITLAAGVLAVILAIVLFASASSAGQLDSMNTGTSPRHKSYGGDAYTGIQQAAADTAQNVQLQSEIIIAGFKSIPGSATGLAAILLCLGLYMIASGLRQQSEIKARYMFEATLLNAVSAIANTSVQPAAQFVDEEQPSYQPMHTGEAKAEIPVDAE